MGIIKNFQSDSPEYEGMHQNWKDDVKHQSIAFNRWRDGEGYECILHDDENIKHWQAYGEGKIYADEELYSLFLKYQTQP